MVPSIVVVLWMATYAGVASSYNLATDYTSAKFITSPVAEMAKKQHQSFATNVTRSSFFGYSFIFTNDKEDSRLIIGSPKTVDPRVISVQRSTSSKFPVRDSRGNIQVCNTTSFVDIATECRPGYPPRPRKGDNFGLELSIRPDGSSFACSPTRELDCHTSKRTPGFCYRSRDFGKTWEATEKRKSQECSNVTVEVLFVLDGSYSVGADFSKVKDWVKNTTRRIGMEENGVRVGVLQYSSYVEHWPMEKQKYIKTHVKIGEHQSFDSFSREVDTIKLFAKGTYTGQALRKVKGDFQSSDYYNRTSTKQVMILLTDGKADDKNLVSENAEKLRLIGVTTFALGVGDVNRTELQIIANGNPGNDSRVFTIKDYSGLRAIAKELETEIGIILEGKCSISFLFGRGKYHPFSLRWEPQERIKQQNGVCRTGTGSSFRKMQEKWIRISKYGMVCAL